MHRTALLVADLQKQLRAAGQCWHDLFSKSSPSAPPSSAIIGSFSTSGCKVGSTAAGMYGGLDTSTCGLGSAVKSPLISASTGRTLATGMAFFCR